MHITNPDLGIIASGKIGYYIELSVHVTNNQQLFFFTSYFNIRKITEKKRRCCRVANERETGAFDEKY